MFAVRCLSVTFPENGTTAVDAVCLSFKTGCIHAIVGENGAGKSTFARVCCGHLPANSGSLFFNGQPLSLKHPADGIRNGILLVPQHPQLCSDVTVWEHLYAGLYTDSALEPCGTGCFFSYNRKKIITYIEKKLEYYGISLPLLIRTRCLDAARIHWTACAEALLKNPQVLFLDEPTAPYSPQETTAFYTMLRKCADSGMTVIVITHRMQEVLDFTDYVHIFRQGKAVASQQISPQLLQEHLIAAVFSPVSPVHAAVSQETKIKEPLKTIPQAAIPAEKLAQRVFETCFDDTMGLYLAHITAGTGQGIQLSDFSFYAPKGMITGVVGIKNQGLELMEEVLTGQIAVKQGLCQFNGEKITQCKNIAYIPSKRIEWGIVLGQSILKNSIIRCRNTVYPYGIFSRKQQNIHIDSLKMLFPRHPHEPIHVLSGGMMQKLIFNRELANPSPRLVICAEPYWGLDRNAQELLLQTLDILANNGAVVLILTSDIDTALNACDSLHVLYGGRITYSVSRAHYNREKITAAMVQAESPDSMYE